MDGQENQGANSVTNTETTNNTGAVTQTAGTQTKTEGAVTQTAGTQTKTEGAVTQTAGTQTKTEGAVTQTAGTQTKTEGAVTQTEKKTEVKTFTQEEVNGMLAKERKNMPSDEELKAFKKWQEAQKTEEQKKQEEIIKNQKLQEKNDFNSQIIEVMKKGLDYDTAEFVQFKVSKMDGDFNENLETYLKDHPQTTKTEEKKSVTTGFSQGKTAGTVVNENKDYLDKKYANNPYYKK